MQLHIKLRRDQAAERAPHPSVFVKLDSADLNHFKHQPVADAAKGAALVA
ncbi:hypothetical protein SDC9_126225 [bioreactor metagenome]|uniref:Uncharacterized protein n=1 Tax=bioreactor metagenome TaxID=1076179 RepID=A0A645CR49_9ZZZZ